MNLTATWVGSVLLATLALGCESENPSETQAPIVYGSCVYTNPFSMAVECKRYVGDDWSDGAASSDCELGVFGAPGVYDALGGCEYAFELGTCSVATGEGSEHQLVFPGEDAAACGDTKMGCEVFAQGSFEPGSVCDGVVTEGSGGGSVFVQPYLECRDPVAGEAPGNGANGQVCTWTLISASTEEERHFADYASCSDVITQRPYYGSGPAGATPPGDARLSDSAYMGEVAWARKQVEASACVCCHSSELSPAGPAQWFVEAEGVWLDSISDSGVAMMAGLADSTAFGAFDPEDNNGFDRNELGVPTTDNQRMRALLVGEWERRGYTIADAANIPPFGGPLASQLDYEPSACAQGQGIDAQGRLVWTGGDARYLYVLDVGSANPGVPPNLDEPAGTRWFVDVPTGGTPFASGIGFGALSGSMRHRIPSNGPAALVGGQSYYLYVLRDIGLPLTRCVFVAP